MTALGYKPKLGTDLTYGGTQGEAWKSAATLGLVRVEQWYPDTYTTDAPVILIGRNGRPRHRITLPGHGKGISPPNKGKTFPPEPLTPAEVLGLLKIIDPTTKAGVRNRTCAARRGRTRFRMPAVRLACDLIKEKFGITDVQAQLGHSNVATTATYLKGLGADEAFEKVAARAWPGGVS